MPPVREDSHCYLLDHSCDDAADEDLSPNLKFRNNNVLKIPRNSATSGAAGKDSADAADADWRDSMFSGGGESGRCASCTDLIISRTKKGGKFKFDVSDRDSADLGSFGCLPSCSSRSQKVTGSKSGGVGGNLQSNNWCCGVGAIASTVKRTTKKLE